MHELSLVRITALEPFAGIMASVGAPLRPHLESARIPAELLNEPDSLITKRQFYQFLGSVAEATDLSDLGLRAGEHLVVDQLGAPGVAMRRAPSLRDACRVFAAFIDRFVEGNRIWIEEPGDESAWLFNVSEGDDLPGKAIADHGAIPMLTSLVRLVAGDDWYPDEIQLQTRRMPEAFAGSPWSDAVIRYAAPATGVKFPGCLLSLPPRALTEAAGGELPGELPATTGGRVESLLEGHLRAGFAMSLDQVSEVVGTAPRTLRRRLADEGLSFRSAIERSRYRVARELLEDDRLKIEAIAHHLGYSGANNFTRAFRRMSGLTPGEFRRQDPAGD